MKYPINDLVYGRKWKLGHQTTTRFADLLSTDHQNFHFDLFYISNHFQSPTNYYKNSPFFLENPLVAQNHLPSIS